jgi:hypothetical protein
MFVATSACQTAEDAFAGALRMLLDETFAHPQLAALVTGG